MKDYGSDFPVQKKFSVDKCLQDAVATLVLAFVIGVCVALFLSTLAGVASGPAAHPAPPHLAQLRNSPESSLPTEQLAPPSGIARLQSEEGWR